jgi:hypothetical protein
LLLDQGIAQRQRETGAYNGTDGQFQIIRLRIFRHVSNR